MNYSPLRYPGGKAKLYNLVSYMIRKIGNEVVYIEPFVGGGGLALSLLLNNDVQSIVINDSDKGIYSFWKAILTETSKFLELIEKTPVTIDEWYRQKEILNKKNKRYSLELGFATFYMNRTNRSGVIKAGPIGGYSQKGKYKLDCRFNKKELIDRILRIASRKNRIKVYNYDIKTFTKIVLPKYENRFTYYDPPYYIKGAELYKNFLTHDDHVCISKMIQKDLSNWLVTYDNVPEIVQLYKMYKINKFLLNYSVANSGLAEELIFSSNDALWPDADEIKTLKINLKIEG